MKECVQSLLKPSGLEKIPAELLKYDLSPSLCLYFSHPLSAVCMCVWPWHCCCIFLYRTSNRHTGEGWESHHGDVE